MKSILPEITNLQFDGTFQTVPVQFYQLWTIFIAVDGDTLPATTLCCRPRHRNYTKQF